MIQKSFHRGRWIRFVVSLSVSVVTVFVGAIRLYFRCREYEGAELGAGFVLAVSLPVFAGVAYSNAVALCSSRATRQEALAVLCTNCLLGGGLLALIRPDPTMLVTTMFSGLVVAMLGHVERAAVASRRRG